MPAEVASRRVGTGAIVLLRADITTLSHDALVNAANNALAGGGGVDGAIHRAGGPAIMEELRGFGGCPTGGAVLTGAGRLRARYVIHAVRPRWRGGGHDEDALLASAYRTAFALAAEHGCRSVATASLATGIYGFPPERAAPIGLRGAAAALEGATSVAEIAWALFSERDCAVWTAALADV